VRLASLISLCLLPVVASGCFLGADPLPANVHDDAGPDSPPPPPDAPPPVMCKNAQNTVDDGHHNAGLNCMAGSCHGGGVGDAPPFTVGGTLWADAGGTIPVKYGIISIVDADGVKLDLVTALNGNFYTSQVVKYPIRVYASKCPSLQQMVSTVQYGACNQCHTNAGGTTTPIMLPPQ
jgi:hypothetical protein